MRNTNANSQDTMAKFEELVELVKQNFGRVIDDHQGRTEENYTVAGVGALVQGDRVRAVALCNSRYFSVNHMYVQDGKVHISRTSIGGAVMPMNHNMSISEAIEAYNEEQSKYPFSSGQIQEVHLISDDRG
ncbi:hypothetical protein D3C81_190630 [compost metagenome]